MTVWRGDVADQGHIVGSANFEAIMMRSLFPELVHRPVKSGGFVVVEIERRVWRKFGKILGHGLNLSLFYSGTSV